MRFAPAFRNPIEEAITLDGSSWIAVRVFEVNGGQRNHFAHSSPVYLEIPNHPLHPCRKEIDWLIQRVQEEITRNEGILSRAALGEYEQALNIYQAIEKDIR